MNLSQMNHAIQWWDRNGRMNTNLLQEVLEAKAGIKKVKTNPKVSKIRSLINSLSK